MPGFASSVVPTDLSQFEREKHVWEKSPLVSGLLGGAKGALVGAPVGSFAAAMGKGSPLLGGIAGAVGVGLLAGIFAATQQRMENIDREAELRYYADQLRSREPFFFMPPPRLFDRLLATANVRRNAVQAGAALAAKRPPLRILQIPGGGRAD